MIHQLRLGFATNSSSTHSILVLKPGQERPENYLVSGGDFGWDFFTASSERVKKRYLFAILRGQLERPLFLKVAASLGFSEEEIKEQLDEDSWRGWYVDHQSVPVIPREWTSENADLAFVTDLVRFYLRDDVVILGGNDNTLSEHPLGGKPLPLWEDGRPDGMVGRKDSRGYWTLFRRDDGTKIRFSFDGQPDRVNPDGADAPELVDLKITDFCPMGCTYCYQDSTTKGRHAPYSRIKAILDELQRLKVFEVAIGGGEPTMHPEFSRILAGARERGIVPNFSTRNLQWFEPPENRQLFKEACGGCAFSVDSVDDARRILSEAKRYEMDLDRFKLQYIMQSRAGGALELAALIAEMLAKHEEAPDLTLLGFKHVGRGEGHDTRPDPLGPVIDFARAKHLSFGIDTPLAAAHEDLLRSKQVPSWCYETEEGRFSMYIDAVDEAAGPSSYCPAKRMVLLKLGAIQQTFADLS